MLFRNIVMVVGAALRWLNTNKWKDPYARMFDAMVYASVADSHNILLSILHF
jgi:hypothetical protein